jgi:hypothetical protein
MKHSQRRYPPPQAARKMLNACLSLLKRMNNQSKESKESRKQKKESHVMSCHIKPGISRPHRWSAK